MAAAAEVSHQQQAKSEVFKEDDDDDDDLLSSFLEPPPPPKAAAPVVAELTIAEQKEAIISAETSPVQAKRELSDPKSTKIVSSFEAALPTSSSKKKADDTPPVASSKSDDVIDHEPAPAPPAAVAKALPKMSPLASIKAKSFAPVQPVKVVVDISHQEEPPKVAAAAEPLLIRNISTATPTVSDGAAASFKAARSGDVKEAKKKGKLASDSEDSSAEEEEEDAPDPVAEHGEKDYEPGKSTQYKEKHSDVEEDDEDDDEEEDYAHAKRDDESPTYELRASLPRTQKAWGNYLIAEQKAAEILGIKNHHFKQVLSRAGNADSDRGKSKGGPKSEAAIASETEKENELMKKMEHTGKGFFAALQPLLEQYLCVLSADKHPEWVTQHPLDMAYDRFLGEKKDAPPAANDGDTADEMNRDEAKALVRNHLRYFGGKTVDEREMIGHEEFCMFLEGRRLLAYLKEQAGFGKTPELRKLCEVLLRGRCAFYQVKRFEEDVKFVKCVITHGVLKDPTDAVALLLCPRVKTEEMTFAGYLSKELALVMQTASYACDTAKNIFRDFREYLRDTCKFTIVKKGTKEERKETPFTGKVLVYLEPPFVTREQVSLFVQTFCDTSPHLFGQYWDCRCVLESLKAKGGGVLHNYKVPREYLNDQDEYGPETLKEIEKIKQKELKSKQSLEKKRIKRAADKEKKKEKEDESIPDSVFD